MPNCVVITLSIFVCIDPLAYNDQQSLLPLCGAHGGTFGRSCRCPPPSSSLTGKTHLWLSLLHTIPRSSQGLKSTSRFLVPGSLSGGILLSQERRARWQGALSSIVPLDLRRTVPPSPRFSPWTEVQWWGERLMAIGGLMLPFHRNLWEKVLKPTVPGCLENVVVSVSHHQLQTLV